MMQDVETLWANFATPIKTTDEYINSLRGRRMSVYFMGERVPEPVGHPVIRPSINAMAETFRVATERPNLGTVHSDIVISKSTGSSTCPCTQRSLSLSMKCSASSAGAPALVSSVALGSMRSVPAIR
jgi:aromatic ring hydroxylase